jgi:hypothetical protein
VGKPHARTCLEYTFACDASALCAEADTAKCGAVDELKDGVWSILCLTSVELMSGDGRSRNAVGSITLRAGDGRPDIRIQLCRIRRGYSGHGDAIVAGFFHLFFI